MLLLILLLEGAVAGSTSVPTTSGQEASTLLHERREEAKASPDQPAALLAWGDALLAALEAGEKLSPGRDVKPCLKALEKAAKNSPTHRVSLLSKAAQILAQTGSGREALEVAWLAVGAELNPESLGLLLSLQKQVDPSQIGATCYIIRSTLHDDVQRLLLIQSCLRATTTLPVPEDHFTWSGGVPIPEGSSISWLSEEDRAFYQVHLDEVAREQAARKAAQEEAERRAAMLVPPVGPGNRRVTAVTGQITCKAGVRLFKGTARGTGTYTWYYPKDNLSYSIREGDQLCICNAQDQRSSCWTANGAASARLVLSCEGFQAE